MKTVDEKLEQLTQILDEYETLNGLPKFQHSELSEEINSYLTMNTARLEKLPPTDCANIAVRLSQQSFHLQRAYNRERSVVTAMSVAFKKSIARHINDYNSYIPYDVNEAAIVNEDIYAQTLQSIIAKATQRMNRLYALSERMQDMANKFLSLQRAKLAILRNSG